MNSPIRAYLAAIGAKGGAAGKGDPARKEICRRAAKARWAKQKTSKTGQQTGNI